MQALLQDHHHQRSIIIRVDLFDVASCQAHLLLYLPYNLKTSTFK